MSKKLEKGMQQIINKSEKKIKDKIPKIPNLEDIKNYYEKLKTDIPRMPITVFYSYLWRHDKLLLLKSLGINYIFPLLLEILPWTSRRKLLIKIRKKRVQINYRMQTNKTFNWDLLKTFILITVSYSFIDTFIRFYQERISLEHKLAIRRLVLQRMLYSEISAFDRLKDKTKDRLIDIGQTLAFFNFTVPAIIASIYALYLEARELWKHRNRIDLLALLYPFLMYFIRRLFDYFRQNLLKKDDDDSDEKKDKHKKKMAEFVSDIIHGLNDIQINNLQKSLIRRLDVLVESELSSAGLTNFIDSFINNISSRSLFQFISETYIIHTIMKRKKIAFDKYLIIQEDLDHCLKAVRKLADLWSVSKKIFDYQKKVVDLINIPNWQGEQKRVKCTKINHFHELRMRNIRFFYPDNNLVPAIDFEDEEMVFIPGKKYAIIGQNQAGKSTLAHIITKVYQPQCGWISLNDIPYSDIGRVCLREIISCISQRTFLFPGTIRDNIKIGNPNASEEEVMEAALSAGLLCFSQQSVTSSPTHHSSRDSNHDHHPYFIDDDDHDHDSSKYFDYNNHNHNHYNDNDDNEDVNDDDYASYFRPSSFARSLITSFTNPDDLSDTDDVSNLSSIEDHRYRNHLHNNLYPVPQISRLREPSSSSSPPPPSPLCNSSSRFNSIHLSDMKEFEMEKIKDLLDQEVLARGINMSGGFAQSVALARIFVKTSAKIIILDEATSQMDSIKKREIIPRIFDFATQHGMTLIIITHDLNSIQCVDKIYVLDGGKIAHRGTHDELISSQASAYLELLGVNINSTLNNSFFS